MSTKTERKSMYRVSTELGELVEVLRDLPDADWDRPSACDGLRVRDVAAHLALALHPFDWRMASVLAGPPSRTARLGGERSVEYAEAHTPAELVALLEQRRDAPRRGFLGKIDPYDNMLADHATHLQDVRVGLDRRAPHEAEQARAVLDATVRVWRPISWGSRERAKGLRLEATDVGWSHGDGPVLTGPYDAMLLALSGRSAGLQHLQGPGLSVMTERMPKAA